MSYAEAYACVVRFIRYYNNDRIHGVTRMEPARLHDLLLNSHCPAPVRFHVAC
jgi:hypothetical protein